MKQIPLTIFDETLRDGEQQVGIFFDRSTKEDLALLIAQTGVHHVALMPAIHETEAQIVRQLTQGKFQIDYYCFDHDGRKSYRSLPSLWSRDNYSF